jgi:hypothetical protein
VAVHFESLHPLPLARSCSYQDKSIILLFDSAKIFSLIHASNSIWSIFTQLPFRDDSVRIRSHTRSDEHKREHPTPSSHCSASITPNEAMPIVKTPYHRNATLATNSFRPL